MFVDDRPPRRTDKWKAEFFASGTGRDTATTLARANQALQDAWPYMETSRWSAAVDAVQADLVDVGLPPDLRPNAVDFVLAKFTA